MTMLYKSEKTNPFKNTKTAYQLNPSYLYDIDMITQTKSWMKLELRHSHSMASKTNILV